MATTLGLRDQDLRNLRQSIPTFSPLPIATLPQLKTNEAEILRRMAAYPLGGNLFVAHPLRFFAEIHVQLAPGVGEQYLQLQGLATSNLSAAYDALKRSSAQQGVTVEMQSLFPAAAAGGGR